MSSTPYNNDFIGLAFEPLGTIVIVPSFWSDGSWWWKKKVDGYSVRMVQKQRACHGEIDHFWKEIGVFVEMEHAQDFVDVMNDIRIFNGGEK